MTSSIGNPGDEKIYNKILEDKPEAKSWQCKAGAGWFSAAMIKFLSSDESIANKLFQQITQPGGIKAETLRWFSQSQLDILKAKLEKIDDPTQQQAALEVFEKAIILSVARHHSNGKQHILIDAYTKIGAVVAARLSPSRSPITPPAGRESPRPQAPVTPTPTTQEAGKAPPPPLRKLSETSTPPLTGRVLPPVPGRPPPRPTFIPPPALRSTTPPDTSIPTMAHTDIVPMEPVTTSPSISPPPLQAGKPPPAPPRPPVFGRPVTPPTGGPPPPPLPPLKGAPRPLPTTTPTTDDKQKKESVQAPVRSGPPQAGGEISEIQKLALARKEKRGEKEEVTSADPSAPAAPTMPPITVPAKFGDDLKKKVLESLRDRITQFDKDVSEYNKTVPKAQQRKTFAECHKDIQNALHRIGTGNRTLPLSRLIEKGAFTAKIDPDALKLLKDIIGDAAIKAKPEGVDEAKWQETVKFSLSSGYDEPSREPIPNLQSFMQREILLRDYERLFEEKKDMPAGKQLPPAGHPAAGHGMTAEDIKQVKLKPRPETQPPPK